MCFGLNTANEQMFSTLLGKHVKNALYFDLETQNTLTRIPCLESEPGDLVIVLFESLL